MEEALLEAGKAAAMGEIPVGAVIVRNGQIIARGHNRTETDRDPTAHAEMIAIRQAAKALGGWRLPGCTMYVTLEPCSMCAGAIVWARIERLVIGTPDPKAGACGSVFNIVQEPALNHRVEVDVMTGETREACAAQMKQFFRELRAAGKGRKRAGLAGTGRAAGKCEDIGSNGAACGSETRERVDSPEAAYEGESC